MQQYVQDGTLRTLPAGAVLTERWSGGSAPRRGIVLAVDLEAYEYTPGSASLIRPTEKTVVERIPPRLKVREGACLELPHIMILIDDPDRRIIEPLFEKTGSFSKLYDTDLMQNGGHITGWFIPQGKDTDAIESGLEALRDRETFNAKYGCTDAQALLPYAVGDGNHSMATAKAYWEEVKKGLTPEEQENHPARFALAEIVNIHDESIIIEPIHRALFGVDGEELLEVSRPRSMRHRAARHMLRTTRRRPRAHTSIRSSPQRRTAYSLSRTRSWAIPVATIQTGLDAFSRRAQGRQDRLYPRRGRCRLARREEGQLRLHSAGHRQERPVPRRCIRRRAAAQDLLHGRSAREALLPRSKGYRKVKINPFLRAQPVRLRLLFSSRAPLSPAPRGTARRPARGRTARAAKTDRTGAHPDPPSAPR